MTKAEKNAGKIKQMKKLEDEVVALKKSPLYKYRTSNGYLPVVGEGSLDSKIVLVGEAPGRNEAKTGRPFCGAAGKILDGLLAGAGIERRDVYITNIVKDRPPENRDPTPEEIRIYGPFLDRQIEIIQPKVIATLGRYAMVYIMKKFGLESQILPIGEAHGKTFKTEAGIEIVVLYHPCVAIYNRKQLPKLETDFKILKDYKG